MRFDRRAAFTTAFIVVAFIVWFQTSPAPRQRVVPKTISPSTTFASEQYGDLIQAFKNDLDNLKQENVELHDQIKQLVERIEKLEKR